MFALVSVAGTALGTYRVRVPDTAGFAQAMHQPLGWWWFHVSGNCGLFSKKPPGLGDGQGPARRHLFLLLYLPSHQLSSLALPLLGGWGLLRCPGALLGCTLGGPIPPPALTGLPRPSRTSPGERKGGTKGTGWGSAPPRDAVPSPSR